MRGFFTASFFRLFSNSGIGAILLNEFSALTKPQEKNVIKVLIKINAFIFLFFVSRYILTLL